MESNVVKSMSFNLIFLSKGAYFLNLKFVMFD